MMPSQLRGRLDVNLPLTYDALMHKVNPNTTRMAKCRNSSGLFLVERLREEAFAEGGNELTYGISPQVT